MSGFTPGPYAVHCSHIYAPDGSIIAQVHGLPLVANRDLLAAAPDLYAALEQVFLDWDGEPEDMIPVQEALIKAGRGLNTSGASKLAGEVS